MPEPVKVGDLVAATGARLVGSGGVEISDVSHDSRQAGPGVLFVAVRGFTNDGHQYVDRAVRLGAEAVCVEEQQDVPVPQLIVADTRAALALLAAEVHHHPSRSLQVIGVTGTNGKTTVAYLLEAILDADRRTGAVVGTIGARIAGRSVELARTTPEASDLQRLLAAMVEAGVEAAAVEVSSHALALNRVDGVWFTVAAFTNLTRDHLDFHRDMEDYFAAKASLFSSDRAGQAVVWVDDAYGARLAESAQLPVTRVGLGPGADIRASSVEIRAGGSHFTLEAPQGPIEIDLPLGGSFNVENALVAAACALAVGIPLAAIQRGLRTARQIPGRFEKIDEGQRFAVYVDYAHTPEGVEAVVEAARRMTAGSVVAVVGAGGDRDRQKRPLMGAAAARADVAIITSDNPRSEDPLAIINQVVEGARTGTARLEEIPDRRAAIRTALHLARAGDVVLILGKGHEQGQEFADRVEPFDDRAVARQELRDMEMAQ